MFKGAQESIPWLLKRLQIRAQVWEQIVNQLQAEAAIALSVRLFFTT